MKKNLLAFLLALLPVINAFALQPFTVRDIRVDGIQRTEAGTVFSYLPVRIGDTMTAEAASRAIKALFATGFFNDVRIEAEGDILVVAVEERPIIAQIDFVGLREFQKDQLIKGLRDSGFAVAMAFDRSMLERAEQELKRQYLTRGRYAAEVTTTITPLERNRVAINFDINEGESARIKQINVVGVRSFRERDILDNFQLQTPNWASWYTKNDRYSRQKLSADLEALRSFYLNRGFLEFAIESTQVSISPDKRGIYITVNISEGERYIVSSVKLAGHLIFPETELRNAVRIRAGDVFSRERLNESTRAISEKLSAMGYAFANVNASPEIDRENNQVALTIFIDPGKRVYVRRINIGGNTKTRDEVIRQEFRQMEAGWYDDQKVRLSKERIDRTGYFSQSTIETPPVPGSPDQLDININVTERRTGSITLGGGYSQAEKIIISGGIAQANIFGSGRFASFQVHTGRINRTIALSYTNPYYTVDGVSRGFDLYSRKMTPFTLGYAFSTESYGGGVRFGIPIAEKHFISFGAAIDYTEVNIDVGGIGVPVNYERFINNFCTPGDSRCGTYSIPLTVGWRRDTRDSAFNPTRGAVQRAGAEYSPGTDLRYYRLTAQQQHYFPVTRNLILMLNGELGYARGLGGQELAFFKNFFAGGVHSVRGYEIASLGPYLKTDDGRIVRLGGSQRVIFNAELMVPMPGFGADKSVRMGPFFDIGQVFGHNNAHDDRVHSSGPPRMSTGVALVWHSFMGPLRFSFARPLNERENDRIQRFQFQMGMVF